MSGVDPLIGAYVNALTFGIAHFSLELIKGDEVYSVSTAADVSCEPAGRDDLDFRNDATSSGLVGLVGAELRGLIVHAVGRGASLTFDDGRQIRAWWPDEIYDNLFIVRREATSDWWVIE